MILSSVIIILREVLEAALIISLLLAFAKNLKIGRRWIWLALVSGLVGASLYAKSSPVIFNWFDGMGQESTNAALQYLLVILLGAIVPLWSRRRKEYFVIVAAVAIAAAIIREGSEIILYLSGYIYAPEQLTSVLMGGVLGLGIGASVGALLFYGLCGLNIRTFSITAYVLLTLIAAGLSAQATNLLVQADWISAGLPLWNSGSWLPEDSVIGQLLYAVIGYEASPSLPEFLVYVTILIGFAGLGLFSHLKTTHNYTEIK